MDKQAMVTVRVSAAYMINLKHHKEPVEFDLAKMDESRRQAFVEYCLDWTMRQSPGDADAGLKDKSVDVKRAAVRAKFDKLASGELPSGGGGRGASLEDVDQAFLDIINQDRKEKVKIADYTKAAKQYAREQLVAAYIAAGKDPKAEAANIMTKAETGYETIRDRILETPEGKAALEKVRASRAKVDTSKVKVNLMDMI
jgi:hypothetical protein